MAAHNTIHIELKCPRCGRTAEHEVDLYFGDTSDMRTIALGEPYPFKWGERPEQGGRLPQANPFGSGYSECPLCNKDFHCRVEIREERIESVEPDMERAPFIPDSEVQSELPCPDCGKQQGRILRFNGFRVGSFLCDDACHGHYLAQLNQAGEITDFPYVSSRPASIQNR